MDFNGEKHQLNQGKQNKIAFETLMTMNAAHFLSDKFNFLNILLPQTFNTFVRQVQVE